jgi:PAS domain S-box-containing protein
VIPLHVSGRIAGAFALYTSQPHSFRAEEVRVLETLAADIAFAVESAEVERERKKLHQNVRAAERLRELIYRSVVDEIFCLAVESDGSLRFASVNPAFLATAGLSEDQVIGRRIEQVLAPASLSWAQAQYERAIRSRQSVSWQDVTETPVGVRHGEVTVAPIFDEAGRCTNLVGTVRDITPRKRAEEERRRLEAQLQQASRMQSLGTLAGGIAHDFNNILTAIGGNAELGAGELLPEHPAYESLSEIRKATRRATDLVRQILTFSRQDKPTRRVLDAREVIDEVLRLMRSTLPPSIQLERDLAADTPLISADGSQLHQVLMNLCTNAAHALEGERGVIRVSSSRCEVDAKWVARQPELREGIHCRIVVSDTGCGMDSSTLARAFEPFFTTRAQGKGTGLGLSVVHGIIQSHGGAISARSAVGKGTSFELYLPAVELPAEAAVAPRAQPSAGAGEHILYVDDDQALVFLAQRLLPRKGYRVTAYTDAAHALSELRARPGEFDAVVTDISMPGMSGADLVRELRQLQPELPIVMTSGYIRPEDLETAQRLGVGDLILKPDSVDELVRVLHQKFSQLRRSSDALPAGAAHPPGSGS